MKIEKPTRYNNQMFIINFCLNMFRASFCPTLLHDPASWTETFIVLTSCKTAPHKGYQPHPAELGMQSISHYISTPFTNLPIADTRSVVAPNNTCTTHCSHQTGTTYTSKHRPPHTSDLKSIRGRYQSNDTTHPFTHDIRIYTRSPN